MPVAMEVGNSVESLDQSASGCPASALSAYSARHRYGAAAQPLWSGPVFRTMSELAFLLLSGSMTAFAVASVASGRAMIIQIVPPMRVGSYFGPFGLTSSTTVWIAPMLIGILTARFHSQAIGLIPIAVLLAARGIGLLFVKGGDRLEE